MKVSQLFTALMVGYLDIMRSLDDAKDLDLLGLDVFDLFPRLERNVLSRFFFSLKDFLVTSSAEAIDLRQTKARSRTPSPKKKSKQTQINDDDQLHFAEEMPNPQPTTSTFSDMSTPRNKRVFSGESFGTSSTETTPAKIAEAEQRTQELQGNLISVLVTHIWRGGPRILWAQNRKMYLGYRPYSPNERSLN